MRQRRVGLNGKEFELVKLRTMEVGAEHKGAGLAVNEGDPRITRVGRHLRRLSIDELPQLWNVACGEMALVGPRPERPELVAEIARQLPFYEPRHLVRPGITGWAQVNGFRGETHSLEKMEGRIRCDLDYLRNWSLRLDLYIILKTVRLVFRDTAAY